MLCFTSTLSISLCTNTPVLAHYPQNNDLNENFVKYEKGANEKQGS